MKRLILIALIGCSSSPSKPAPPTNTGGSAASETSCTADTDCVVVETQCCDHCNGGSAQAFNAAAADSHKPSGCEGTMCTELACGKAIAKCESGTCKVSIAPL